MGCFAVDLLKQPDEMKLGKTRLLGNIVEVDLRRKMGVDKELCPYDTAV